MFQLVRNPDPRKKPPYGSKLDPTHPLSQGLVGCWLLNEGGGNVIYDLAQGIKGTFRNSPKWKNEDILFTSDNSDYISMARNPMGSGNNDFTLFAVAIPNSNPSSYFGVVTIGGLHNLAYLGQAGNSNWGCGFWGSNHRGNIPLIIGKTTSIATTYKAGLSIQELYVDGIFDSFFNESGSVLPSDSGFIGTITEDQYFFNGYIKLSYIYNRALSPIEIAWLHHEPYVMFDYGISVWMFDTETTGGSIIRVINETLQFNEATLKLQATQKIINETLQLSELVEKKGATKKVINETLQISESTPKTSGMIKIISETLQIAESFAKISGITKVVNEALQLSESISRKIGITKIVNETLQLVEGVKKLSWTTKIVNEILRFNEALFKRGTTKKVINETLQISETTGRLAGITKIINESLQIAESLAKITGITKVVNETLQLNESVLQKTGITKIINETLQISEKIKKLSWTTKVVNETLQLSETLFKKVSIKKIINETLQLSENIARKSGLIKIINEVLNIGEKIIRTLAIALGWREVVKGDSRITTMITGDSRITTMITGDSPLD